MATVTVSDVKKDYGSVQVIHGIDIDIEDGEFVVLVGPSGCGKSTLLRMIAGLEEISGGEVKIAGKVVNDAPPKQRDIAMVFQNYALYPHMTVAKNMGFSLHLQKVPKKEIDQKVQRAAEILGLEALLDRLPKQLSGGQRQRVAMGRAIVRAPQVFLFDEPLSNLDAKLRVQMRAEIRELHQRLRTTTVYVTHDQVEAMTMADKIVVLRSGYVEQIGSPLDLYDTPANRFVAGFIGSPAMNFIEGTVQGGAEPVFVGREGETVKLPSKFVGIGSQPATLGVRPEHVSVVPVGTPGSLTAKVMVVEPTGAETLVITRLGPSQITAVSKERQRLQSGQEIGLSFEVPAVHLFEHGTARELRIIPGH